MAGLLPFESPVFVRICFIHQNIPAQFRHLIDGLLARGDEVVVIGQRKALARWPLRHQRLHQLGYEATSASPPDAASASGIEFERMAGRGRAVGQALRLLLSRGLRPDMVVAHPGWGEMMFVRAELPDTPLLAYCEFFYSDRGTDVDFDAEFPSAANVRYILQLRRAVQLLALNDMDAGLCPTAWQRAVHPAPLQPKLHVLHDGIDTDRLRPHPAASVCLNGVTFRAGDPVVTYVARNLEPYRGFHIFMRCLPQLLRRVPQAQIVVVGGDDVSYGRRLQGGESYRARLLAEMGGQFDLSHVHFVGRLAPGVYQQLLQVSAVHAYLTYPFVLSWSLLEAMSAGCCVVASRTPPVQEVIEDKVNGHLVDFFDVAGLAAQLAEVLLKPQEATALRQAARRTVVNAYDLQRVCLPKGLALLDRLASRQPVEPLV